MTQHFVFESVPGYSPIHDDRERIKEPVAAGKSQRNERKVWGYGIHTSDNRWVYFINAKRFAEIEGITV